MDQQCLSPTMQMLSERLLNDDGVVPQLVEMLLGEAWDEPLGTTVSGQRAIMEVAGNVHAAMLAAEAAAGGQVNQERVRFASALCSVALFRQAVDERFDELFTGPEDVLTSGRVAHLVIRGLRSQEDPDYTLFDSHADLESAIRTLARATALALRHGRPPGAELNTCIIECCSCIAVAGHDGRLDALGFKWSFLADKRHMAELLAPLRPWLADLMRLAPAESVEALDAALFVAWSFAEDPDVWPGLAACDNTIRALKGFVGRIQEDDSLMIPVQQILPQLIRRGSLVQTCDRGACMRLMGDLGAVALRTLEALDADPDAGFCEFERSRLVTSFAIDLLQPFSDEFNVASAVQVFSKAVELVMTLLQYPDNNRRVLGAVLALQLVRGARHHTLDAAGSTHIFLPALARLCVECHRHGPYHGFPLPEYFNLREEDEVKKRATIVQDVWSAFQDIAVHDLRRSVAEERDLPLRDRLLEASCMLPPTAANTAIGPRERLLLMLCAYVRVRGHVVDPIDKLDRTVSAVCSTAYGAPLKVCRGNAACVLAGSSAWAGAVGSHPEIASIQQQGLDPQHALWETRHACMEGDIRMCFNPWCAQPTCAQYKKCGRCRCAQYCSRECQRQAWAAVHKATCATLRG